MSKRIGFLKACVVGAVLGGTALISTDAFAQCCQGGGATAANAFTDGLATSASWPADPWLWPADNASLLKAPPVAPFWWTHGEIEVGGRDFLNDPTVGGSIWGDTNHSNFATGGYAFLGQQSLAKYYEYSIVAPGAFGGGHVATGTSDGLYQIDLWANNVASNFQGFSDQSYMLTASKAGEQYLTFIWDQTPHVYSTSAQTIWNGVGSNNLTLPAGLVANPLKGNVNANAGAAAGGILPYLYGIDLGIQRNTAAVIYRATDPWMSWDATANYSYMTRTGTQAAGIVEMNGFQPTTVPAPVDDNTQNFGAKGEYIGTSLWGQKFTFKAAYNGSIYTDNISSYTVQNPWFPTAASAGVPAPCTKPTAAASGTANCGSAQLSTWPSNQMNGFSTTTSADLPWNSRYVGTTSYEMMTQNAGFLPMTNNPFAAASPNGVPWNMVGALPVQSLGGDINTLLSNNVITTRITPELTNKLTYRYYDFDNQTPRVIEPCWISYDGTGRTPTSTAAPCGGGGFEDSISSLSISYIKQNAGEELNWRPTKEWNFTAAGGWEGYNYTEADAGYTNEYSVKGSVDWKPFSWLTARASGFYSDRTAGNYNYLNNVAMFQYPVVGNYTAQCAVITSGCGGWVYSTAYQQFMFDNRQRTKADFLLDIVVAPGVTVTPTFKYKDDYYPLNTATGAPVGTLAEGLSDQKMISGGVDVAWVVTPGLSIVASYYYEYYHQNLYSGTSNAFPTAATLVTTIDDEFVNTVTVAAKWAAIPNSLDFDVRYSVSDGVDKQACNLCTWNNLAGVAQPVGTPFPNDTTLFQRVDATATYKFDPSWVQQMGFKGDLLFRLRYTWESNSVSNWQNDPLAPYTDIPAFTANALWLAYDNPNYNVQMLSASLIARW
ncbi:MAG: MtrB/PioB family decaheme-associated outer membrane protein [Xanthobacteraceae bacterium]